MEVTWSVLRDRFTGGGSAGHVTPNIAIIHEIKNEYERGDTWLSSI
ncbi:hypothetical protein [Bacillus andreraoultii]|nr:hypothetical protein [Bacillus andreraoultii]